MLAVLKATQYALGDVAARMRIWWRCASKYGGSGAERPSDWHVGAETSRANAGKLPHADDGEHETAARHSVHSDQ